MHWLDFMINMKNVRCASSMCTACRFIWNLHIFRPSQFHLLTGSNPVSLRFSYCQLAMILWISFLQPEGKHRLMNFELIPSEWRGGSRKQTRQEERQNSEQLETRREKFKNFPPSARQEFQELYVMERSKTLFSSEKENLGKTQRENRGKKQHTFIVL